MNDNTLIREIRKNRDEILASHQGDYEAMMLAMKKNQWESGHEVVHLASEKPRKTRRTASK